MSVNDINGLNGQTTSRTTTGGKVSVTRGDGAASQNATANNSAPGTDDSVSLTDMAARLRGLEASLAEQPEVDSDRVAAIQRALEDGSYQVDATRIADKLLNFEASFGE